MDQKMSLRRPDEDGDEEERRPLNAMVAGNIKEIIITRIQKDVDRGTSKVRSSPVGRQYLAALGPLLANISCGMAAGYSAVLLPQLMAEDTEIVITKSQGSWIASLLILPLILGCLASGYLLEILGRKRAHYVSCVPFTCGWIILALAPNLEALYAGRIVTGFCVGLLTPLIQVYLAETSQPDQRGVLLSGSSLAISLGILINHVIGTFLHWRINAWICSLPPALCMVILPFVRESPTWLAAKGRIKEAEDAFRWFRGDSDDVEKEIKDLVDSAKARDTAGSTESKLRVFLKPSFVKPFLVLNFFFFVQQFSGVNAITSYTVYILKKIMTRVNEYSSTLVIDVVRLLASVISILLLRRFGRKTLALTSAIGTAISLFLLTLYLGSVHPESVEGSPSLSNATADLNSTTLESLDPDDPDAGLDPTGSVIWTYVPLISLVLYICFVTLGLVPLPWILSGELFSKETRGIGCGLSTSFAFVCYFTVVKLTPDLFESLDDYGTFCLFGVIVSLGCIVLWIFLPETKDKTLSEIEAYYTKEKAKPESICVDQLPATQPA